MDVDVDGRAAVDAPAVDAEGLEVSAALPGAAVAAEAPKKKGMFSFLSRGTADVPSAGLDADSAAMDVEGAAPGIDVDGAVVTGAAGALPSVEDTPSVSMDVPAASDVRGPDLVIPSADSEVFTDAPEAGASVALPDASGSVSAGLHGPDMTIPSGDAAMPSTDVEMYVDVPTAPDVDVSASLGDVDVSAPEGGLDVGSLSAGAAAGAAGVAGALGAGLALSGDKAEGDVKVAGPDVDVDVDAPDASLDVDVDKPKEKTGFLKGLFGRKKGDIDASATLPGLLLPYLHRSFRLLYPPSGISRYLNDCDRTFELCHRSVPLWPCCNYCSLFIHIRIAC